MGGDNGNPDTADSMKGRRPLWRPVDNGYEEVMRVLWERNDLELWF